MIELVQGDILKADVEALVNTVNCVGVMGRGIALQFRKAFPDNYSAYKKACGRGEVQTGKVLIVSMAGRTHPRFIVNFPTKKHWKGDSRLEYIESGLEHLVTQVEAIGIESIAIPPLGCGLGGLDWGEVRPLIERAFAPLPSIRVLVYEPVGAPDAREIARTAKVPAMTTGRAALLGLVRRYLAALLDPEVTLLEIHKLMYFLQLSGEPLKLQFQKGRYGPYAENLRHVLHLLEGHWVEGYIDGGDEPGKVIQLKPGAETQADQFLATHPETRARFEQVAALVSGFETPFGMELLATVHWVVDQGGAASVPEALTQLQTWSKRKAGMFDEGHIRAAWDTLGSHGFLPTSERRLSTANRSGSEL